MSVFVCHCIAQCPQCGRCCRFSCPHRGRPEQETTTNVTEMPTAVVPLTEDEIRKIIQDEIRKVKVVKDGKRT